MSDEFTAIVVPGRNSARYEEYPLAARIPTWEMKPPLAYEGRFSAAARGLPQLKRLADVAAKWETASADKSKALRRVREMRW